METGVVHCFSREVEAKQDADLLQGWWWRRKWPREENFLVLTGRVTFSGFESVIIYGSFGRFVEEGGINSVNNSRNRIPARVFQLEASLKSKNIFRTMMMMMMATTTAMTMTSSMMI